MASLKITVNSSSVNTIGLPFMLLAFLAFSTTAAWAALRRE